MKLFDQGKRNLWPSKLSSTTATLESDIPMQSQKTSLKG